ARAHPSQHAGDYRLRLSRRAAGGGDQSGHGAGGSDAGDAHRAAGVPAGGGGGAGRGGRAAGEWAGEGGLWEYGELGVTRGRSAPSRVILVRRFLPALLICDMTGPLKLLARLREAIRVRHYSRRTEKAYVWWVRRYVRFCGVRHPRELGPTDVTRFLSSLAIDRHVSASTQNQALSAL